MDNDTCAAPECGNAVYIKKRRLCQSHYNRFMAYGDLKDKLGVGACGECAEPVVHRAKKGPPARYCSYDCKRKAAYTRRLESGGYERDREKQRAAFVPKPRTDRPCRNCGAAFTAKKSDAEFCSSACYNRHLDENNPKRCTEADCDRGVRAKGLCSMHWRRQARADGREANPVWNERRKAGYHKRRAQKSTTQVEDIEPRDIYERDIWLCGLCSTPVDPDVAWPDPMSPSLDHIQPLSKGGAHTYENVQLAHLTCNVSKGNRLAA